jgi:hypothetical protein
MIVPTPWRLVEPEAIILGRDGREVRVWPLEVEDDTRRVAWQDADGLRGQRWVALDAIAPVVLPDVGRALSELYRAFPETQILQITDM